MLTTVEGEILTTMMHGANIMLMDQKGGTATITIPNGFQSRWSIRYCSRSN
jgi:hypothetical protein